MVIKLCRELRKPGYKNSNFIINTLKLKCMNIKLLLIFLLVVSFTSCTTAYRTGQTPDDVYYSPVRAIHYDTIQTHRNDDQIVYNNSDDGYYRTNTRRYRRYHNYDYNCFPDAYGNYIYIDPKTGKTAPYISPRKINVGGYVKVPTPIINTKTGKVDPAPPTPTRTFKTPANNSNGTAVGNLIRDIFSGNNNNSGSSSTGTNRSSTGTNPGSSSTPTNSSGSTKVPVRKFGDN